MEVFRGRPIRFWMILGIAASPMMDMILGEVCTFREKMEIFMERLVRMVS
jgi:hypothetical protein